MKRSHCDLVISTEPHKGVVFWPSGQDHCTQHQVVEKCGYVLVERFGSKTAVYFDCGRLFDWAETPEDNMVSLDFVTQAVAKMMNMVIDALPVSVMYLKPEIVEKYVFVDDDGGPADKDAHGGIVVAISYAPKE